MSKLRNFRSHPLPLLLVVVLALLFGAHPARPQAATGGSVRGVVTDATGALLSGAVLKLKDPGTQAERTQTATGSGQYSFSNIEPGVYTLSVSATGFQETRYDKVTVILNETRELNVALSAGAVTEVVVVQSDQASIVSLETQVGTIIDEQQIKELPLNGRDFQNLVFLAPGASRTASGTGQGSGVSAGGSRPTNNNYLVDGGDANDPRVPSGSAGNTGSAISAVPLDAIAEFSIITSNASAEFGRSSGGVINVITKSGDNGFHATAWEFLRNSVLNTRNFFNPIGFKSPFKQNQFGFWVGGRLIRDRTFFSTSYEGFRQRSTSPNQVPVPTTQFLAALTNPLAKNLFSAAYPAAVGPVGFDPANTATWSTTVLRNVANNLDGDTGFLRIDQKVTGKNHFFATGSILDSVPSAASNGALLPHFGVGSTSRPAHYVGQDDHIFTPNLLNTARFSYQRTPISYPTELLSAAQVAAGASRTAGPNAGQPYSPSVGDPNGIPSLSFTSGRFSTLGFASNFPQGRAPEVYTYQDALSWQHGRHELKFGAQISQVHDNTTFSNAIRPVVSISDSTASTAFANINNLVLNSQTQSFYLVSSARQYRLLEQGYFVQDSYRVTNRVTIDLGLRYEIFNPFTEANNLLSNTYLLDTNNNPAPCTGLPFDSTLSAVAIINPSTYKIGNYCTSYNYYSPRAGFAYDVFGTGKTVIRGGYGMFYDRVFGNVYGNGRFNPPATISTSITTGSYTGAIAASTVNTTQAYSLTNIAPNLRNATTNHFNIAVSQQLDNATALTLSYVGALGQHLLTSTRPNFGTSFANAFRPANQGTTRSQTDVNNGIIRGPFADMTYHQSNGTSNYNALLVNVRRRLNSGVSLEASYGWSHSMDVLSDDVAGSSDSAFPAASIENLLAPYMAATSSCTAAHGVGVSGSAASVANMTAAVQCAEGNPSLSQAQAQTIFLQKYARYVSIKSNYGDSSFDVRQRFASSVIYKLPFGHNEKFLGSVPATTDKLIGGWALASIFDTQTGVPFIPTSGVDANRDGDTTDRVTVTGPVTYRGGKLTKSFVGAAPVINYFSACTAANNCPFASGDGVIDPTLRMHRGFLRNPGIFNWDAQLTKQTSLNERFKLRFSTDFFNVLNHANFSNLTSSIASSQFGQSLSTRALGQTQSRQIQFGLKLQF